MATVRVGTAWPLDMRVSQTFYGTATIATSSQIEIVAAPYVGDYFGQGFSYSSSGMLVGGTVTGYSVTFNSTSIFSVTGLTVPATTVYQLVQSGNQAQLKALALSGNDTIYGAGNGDVLIGGGGSNTFVGVQAGVDYVAYSGAASAYQITADATGFRVTRPDGGSDELVNIKGVYFSDKTALLSANGTVTTATIIDSPQISSKTVGIYRFFDRNDGTHFFTSSTAEANQVAANRTDLVFEGLGLRAVNPGNLANDTAAVSAFRFFDSRHGTHFYTTSQSERQTVLNTRPDLTPEGIAFYAHSSQQSGDTAVYRFFDTNNGTHFYTGSASEAAQISSTRADLKAEGVGFYVPAS